MWTPPSLTATWKTRDGLVGEGELSGLPVRSENFDPWAQPRACRPPRSPRRGDVAVRRRCRRWRTPRRRHPSRRRSERPRRRTSTPRSRRGRRRRRHEQMPRQRPSNSASITAVEAALLGNPAEPIFCTISVRKPRTTSRRASSSRMPRGPSGRRAARRRSSRSRWRARPRCRRSRSRGSARCRRGCHR